MAMSPGTVVAGYRIVRVLGRGGMGTVYLARHPVLPRMDALKVLNSELSSDADYRARFEREANLAAALDHPNIVSIFNRGEENEQLWIAMQYVPGTDAAAELVRNRGAMPPGRALHIINEVGKGLDYAHRRGVLHRDIKPANMLLSAADNDERVLLTDFGVAKPFDDTKELTQSGNVVATVAYAAPEHLEGLPLDPRADIYSLACSLYKLLTGRNPYPYERWTAVILGHLHHPPPRPTAVDPTLPSGLDAVFAKAMAKNPAARFDNCREMTEAVAEVLFPRPIPFPEHAVPPPRESPPRSDPRIPFPDHIFEPTAPPSRTRRIALAAVVLVIALLVGIGIWKSVGSGGPTPPTTTTTATAPTSREEARAQNPVFAGKQILMVDVTGGADGKDPDIAVYLDPTSQTTFLRDLGFAYSPGYTRRGDETSPRPLAREDLYTAFPNSGYVLAVRSDAKAGGKGLLGLPYALITSHATVIVLDDSAAVNAMRTWTGNSDRILLDKLVTELRARVQ